MSGKNRVRDNTLIVYVTDNGWIQDLEGLGFAPRSKQSPYEGGVRTPIIFSWPNKLTPAKRPGLSNQPSKAQAHRRVLWLDESYWVDAKAPVYWPRQSRLDLSIYGCGGLG